MRRWLLALFCLNQVLFFTGNNPVSLMYFMYNSNGTISTVPAGIISVAAGSQQISVLSSKSVGQQ